MLLNKFTDSIKIRHKENNILKKAKLCGIDSFEIDRNIYSDIQVLDILDDLTDMIMEMTKILDVDNDISFGRPIIFVFERYLGDSKGQYFIGDDVIAIEVNNDYSTLGFAIHELFHHLDYCLGQQIQKLSSSTDKMFSEIKPEDSKNKKLSNLFYNIINIENDFVKESIKCDELRASLSGVKYYSDPTEIMTRCFERYIFEKSDNTKKLSSFKKHLSDNGVSLYDKRSGSRHYFEINPTSEHDKKVVNDNMDKIFIELKEIGFLKSRSKIHSLTNKFKNIRKNDDIELDI